MSGAVMALASAQTASGGSGTPSGLSWTNIAGAVSGATNFATVSGVSGSVSITATVTGGGTLYANHNGVFSTYTGAFTIQNGDTLGWTVTARSGAAGTVTIASGGTTLASFTYYLDGRD